MTHGTLTGLTRHIRAGEEPCDECQEARRKHRREKYADNPKLRDAARVRNYRRTAATRELIRRHRTEYLEILRSIPEARKKR